MRSSARRLNGFDRIVSGSVFLCGFLGSECESCSIDLIIAFFRLEILLDTLTHIHTGVYVHNLYNIHTPTENNLHETNRLRMCDHNVTENYSWSRDFRNVLPKHPGELICISAPCNPHLLHPPVKWKNARACAHKGKGSHNVTRHRRSPCSYRNGSSSLAQSSCVCKTSQCMCHAHPQSAWLCISHNLHGSPRATSRARVDQYIKQARTRQSRATG